MAIHFSTLELVTRRESAIEGIAKRGLAGLLIFRQESMYYLTGYDTFGYCFFQCLYLAADGRMVLLTRVPDLRQAQHTSVIEDIRIWVDEAGKNPADELREILDEHDCKGRTLGIEFDAYGPPLTIGAGLSGPWMDFVRWKTPPTWSLVSGW